MECRVSQGGCVDGGGVCMHVLYCIYEDKLNQQEMKRKLTEEKGQYSI